MPAGEPRNMTMTGGPPAPVAPFKIPEVTPTPIVSAMVSERRACQPVASKMAEARTAIETTTCIVLASSTSSTATPNGRPKNAPPVNRQTDDHNTSPRTALTRWAEATTSRQKMIGTASSTSMRSARPLTQINEAPKPVKPRMAAPTKMMASAATSASAERSTVSLGLGARRSPRR